MHCDILITGADLLTPDYKVEHDRAIAIVGQRIAEIGPTAEMAAKYQPAQLVSGEGKLAMPGLVDAHTHTCQQLLRARATDEYPMIWTRFLVPFESNLTPDDVYWSAQLACLEMIKSGTTSFADSGGVHMDRVVQAVLESGMRAAIARSTMDQEGVIPDSMKDTTQSAMEKAEKLFAGYNGAGDDRVRIWFAMRQVMSCSPELIRQTAARAKELGTGVHAHLCEHKDEVSFCLKNYQKRPAAFLDEMGMVGENFLTAHNVVLSEGDITLLVEKGVKIVHCPRANLSNHGFPKTPRILECGGSVGMGSDGACSSSLSLFDEMKVMRNGIIAYWGLPIFDPVVIRVEELVKMATQGGANALLQGDDLGSLEAGKKADVILIDIEQPHILPTHNLVSTLVEAVTVGDVNDSIIDGKLVMKDRQVLTLDEEKILAEAKKRMVDISARAGI